jgi:hypothetical protein
MPSCPPIAFNSMTAEKFAALIQTAQSQGLAITGPTGSTSYQGMSFTWNYDPATESLTLQCTEKPIFIPCSMIESRIRALIV